MIRNLEIAILLNLVACTSAEQEPTATQSRDSEILTPHVHICESGCEIFGVN